MLRLCIVDDELIIRRGLASLEWNSIGFHLSGVASNGEEAIELLESELIDVVLADIRMPGLDGLELAEYVLQEYPNTRFVLLSGYDDFEYAQRAIAHRVVSYLLKPSSPDEILKAVSAAGTRARESRWTDLRIKQLEAELGERRLTVEDANIVLGSAPHGQAADDALRYMATHFREAMTLTSMSAELAFSSIYLSRVIKETTGYTFSSILNSLRTAESARLLRSTDRPFSSIARSVGASDPRYFSQVFKKFYGCTPREYRRKPVAPLEAELSIKAALVRKMGNGNS